MQPSSATLLMFLSFKGSTSSMKETCEKGTYMISFMTLALYRWNHTHPFMLFKSLGNHWPISVGALFDSAALISGLLECLKDFIFQIKAILFYWNKRVTHFTCNKSISVFLSSSFPSKSIQTALLMSESGYFEMPRLLTQVLYAKTPICAFMVLSTRIISGLGSFTFTCERTHI